MKRWLVVAIVLSAAACLPTRNGTPFHGDGDADPNNVTDMAPNNVTDDMTPNNVTDDMAPNNVTDDMAPNNVTDDMTTTPDMASPDACMPEADGDFCDRVAAGCGMFTGPDNCGTMRTADCGACPGGAPCVQNVCDNCVPENDQQFCQRLAAECGLVTELDNCRAQRTVNCGGCPGNGVGCTMQHVCVEVNCQDGNDNDGQGGTDCADSACLGMRCSNNPNQECLANGTCG